MTETATTTPALEVQEHDKLYIDGRWVEPDGKGRLDVIDSATEEVMGRVPEGTAEDARRAVAAARAAFPSWSQTPPEKRAEYLEKIQQGLQARSEELVTLLAHELGMPVRMGPIFQLGSPPFVFGYYANLIRSFAWDEEVGNSLIVKEPVGVVAAITPWNYPLHQIALKVAPALAAGCTVVLKPSGVTPLNAFVLAEIIDAAGLPAGVFNLVTGPGTKVGETLASHPDVDMVSFTGSTTAGRRIQELGAQTIKRVALELGGKSANVILDDADLQKAVGLGVRHVLRNTGQSCDAWTRMLVPRSRYEEAVKIAKDLTESATLGNPLDPEVTIGPMSSKSQQETVRRYIRKGVEEGARLVTGGDEAPDGLAKGFYVKPTIFADVRSDMTIAQEEIFGPVIAMIPYDTEDEAVEIANDSIYGLSGAVFSGDEERAKRVARRIRTGRVDINGGTFNLMAPFGGYKQSGLGRELGTYGFEEFLEVKALQL
jgi:aldehyde dehydrogenase (NAD+)